MDCAWMAGRAPSNCPRVTRRGRLRLDRTQEGVVALEITLSSTRPLRTILHAGTPWLQDDRYLAVAPASADQIVLARGILFNHESPRRGETFVTRKITSAAPHIKLGMQDKLYLGNLDSRRDWGYAPDYVRGMWMMLQQDKPDDYVVATNETHSVREFVVETFRLLDLDWEEYVDYDKLYERPTEVDLLIGDYSKAKRQFGWEPTVKFKELVRIMVESDLNLARRESAIQQTLADLEARP